MLDVFSRKVVGWAMANHLRTELVLEALNMAIAQRLCFTETFEALSVNKDRIRIEILGSFPVDPGACLASASQGPSEPESNAKDLY